MGSSDPFEPTLQGTLRGHRGSVSVVQTFYLPTGITYSQGPARDLLNATLLTGDEHGFVIWWDLSTRRPIGRWNAHGDNAVLTIEQLGVDWSLVDGMEQPTIDLDRFGSVLTHGKDGEIKVWRLFEPSRDPNGGLISQPSTALQRKLDVDVDPSQIPPIEFQMPVNMMNFSNVAIYHDLLATPATQDSNNFDLYRVPRRGTDDQLNRLLKNVGTGDSGIIMKMAWAKDRLVLGYENGKLVQYDVDGKQLSSDDTLCSQPVTALYYDSAHDHIYSGSASDTLVCDSQSFHIKHKGIGDIKVSTGGVVGLVTWNGYARFYKDQTLLFKIARKAPSIANNRPQSDDIKAQNADKNQRGTFIAFSKHQPSLSRLVADNEANFTNGRCKNLIRHRVEKSYDTQWLFVGYQDGKIQVYAL